MLQLHHGGIDPERCNPAPWWRRMPELPTHPALLPQERPPGVDAQPWGVPSYGEQRTGKGQKPTTQGATHRPLQGQQDRSQWTGAPPGWGLPDSKGPKSRWWPLAMALKLML